MRNGKFNRSFFFWVDKLQISKQERISITILLGLTLVLLLLNIFIRDHLVPPPENHAELLTEFERRSALIKREDEKLQEKYYPGSTQKEMETEGKRRIDTTRSFISINEASIQELVKLPGIGNTYAERIVEYRETNGAFTSVDDLVKVRGIGIKTLEKLRPFIKL